MKITTCIVCFVMCFQVSLSAQKRFLFLIAGQSNAVGQGNKDSSEVPPRGKAFEYRYSDNSLVPLIDPFGEEALNFQKANKGSIGPAFAKRLNETSGSEIVLLSAARGGASCFYKAELKGMGTWDTTGQMRLFDSAVLKAKAARKKTGLSLQGIIWLQGERDANAINNKQVTPAEYKAALISLINRFRQSLKSSCPFYIVQTGYYTGFPQEGFDAVRKAQEEVAASMKEVYVAYSATNSFKEKGWMHDAIHYNQQGLNDIGKTVADFVMQEQRKNHSVAR